LENFEPQTKMTFPGGSDAGDVDFFDIKPQKWLVLA